MNGKLCLVAKVSRGVNKAIIVGTLGKDPEVRYTAGGVAIANLSVATNEVWRDKQSGENQERTEWHRISIFGKLAEIAQQYLKKGSHAYFEGRIQTRKWQDQSGNDRYSTEIVANEMQMLGGRSDTNRSQGSSSHAESQTRQPAGSNRPMQDDDGPAKQPPLDDGFDDIPF